MPEAYALEREQSLSPSLGAKLRQGDRLCSPVLWRCECGDVNRNHF
ncbi:MAG: hypothetical protein ACYCYE_05285 [Clostridia bacterium]